MTCRLTISLNRRTKSNFEFSGTFSAPWLKKEEKIKENGEPNNTYPRQMKRILQKKSVSTKVLITFLRYSLTWVDKIFFSFNNISLYIWNIRNQSPNATKSSADFLFFFFFKKLSLSVFPLSFPVLAIFLSLVKGNPKSLSVR